MSGSSIASVITNGTVITGAGRENADVFISHGKIAAIASPGVIPVPEGAREIDASGCWVLPGMIERQYGRMVYTSSTAGLIAEHAGSAYNSSKHGLLGLMRSVAQDAGRYNITSNAVLPGWVRTEMAERSARQEATDRGITADQVWIERAALYPPGRVASPQEVAEMIAFLASEESSGVSGEAIRVALGSVW